VRLSLLLLAVPALVLVACGSEYPGFERFGGISGTIEYSGSVQDDLANPALGVYAFASWPPAGLPHGSRLFIAPDFSQGSRSYELLSLDPYEYIVLAMLIDLEEPITMEMDLSDPEGLPPAVGAYPNLLTFVDEPVTVRAGEVTRGIDVQLVEF